MLKLVIEARKASLGDGMQVQRILPFRKQRMVGPFIFMDHGGACFHKSADEKFPGRAAAPAYWLIYRELSLQWRAGAQGQPGGKTGDPAGGGELDDGRERDIPFGTF